MQTIHLKGVRLEIDFEHEGDGVLLVHRIFIGGVDATELLLEQYYEDIVDKLKED